MLRDAHLTLILQVGLVEAVLDEENPYVDIESGLLHCELGLPDSHDFVDEVVV